MAHNTRAERVRSMAVRLIGGAAVVATTAVSCSVPAAAERPDPPGHDDTNHCDTDTGAELNEVFGVPEQFASRYCSLLTAGEAWRPLPFVWIVNPTFEAVPEGFVAAGETPVEDLASKLRGVEVVVDAGTRQEARHVFSAAELRTDVTLDQLQWWQPPLPIATTIPKVGPLSVGDHTVAVIWDLAAMHCDGMSTSVQHSCLRAGRVRWNLGTFTVSSPDVDPATEGRPSPLVQVADIYRGVDGSVPGGVTESGGSAFFTATDAPTGTELWVTSTQGARVTRQVADIRLGPEGSNPQSLTDVDGTLFFTADDGIHGPELWASDGTAAGTRMVRDIQPDPGPGAFGPPSALTAVDGTLLFTAFDPEHGAELWRSDGTAGGTAIVRDINPGPDGSGPQEGTEYTFPFAVVDGQAYFNAFTPDTGFELWRSDGSEAGTVLVRDIQPGPAPFEPRLARLTAVGHQLFMIVVDDATGTLELWRSDGSAPGTIRLRVLFPPPATWPQPRDFRYLKPAAMGGALYFTSLDEATGVALWRTDGTVAGTRIVADSSAGFEGLSGTVVASGGAVYFTASRPDTGSELWRSDGTAAGTRLVRDIAPGTASPTIGSMADVGGRLFFTAYLPEHGFEPWSTDGTSAGTALVQDILPGPESGIEFACGCGMVITDIGGSAFFAATDGIHGQELWTTRHPVR